MANLHTDGAITASPFELRQAPLPPDVEMRVESILHNARTHAGGVIRLVHGDGILQLNDRDYAAVKEGLNLP